MSYECHRTRQTKFFGDLVTVELTPTTSDKRKTTTGRIDTNIGSELHGSQTTDHNEVDMWCFDWNVLTTIGHVLHVLIHDEVFFFSVFFSLFF